MSIFRSEEVDLYSISIAKDDCWVVMNELGKMNALHFIDLNSNEQIFNRTFANSIKRCEDAERSFHYIESLCNSFKVRIQKPSTIHQFYYDLSKILEQRGKDKSTYIDDIIHDLGQKEKSLQEHMQKYEGLKLKEKQIVEKKAILQSIPTISAQVDNMSETERPLMGDKVQRILSISGIVERSFAARIKQMIFRSTRGNAYVNFSEAENVIEDEKPILEGKTIITIMYQGGEDLKAKIQKILDVFEIRPIEIQASRTEELKNAQNEYSDNKNVLVTTQNYIIDILQQSCRVEGSSGSLLFFQKWVITQEKTSFFYSNMLKSDGNFFKGLCWCPASSIIDVNSSLTNILGQTSGLSPPQLKKVEKHSLDPHTKLPTNEFTQTFQDIVSTYGVPSYQEINPAFFTIMTFPFLFGVMFGDCCHGVILFFISLYLVCRAEAIEKSQSLLSGLVGARYLLLFCGFFATFCGLIYNDFAGISLRLFNSSYSMTLLKTSSEINVSNSITNYDVNITFSNSSYPFGFDPLWSITTNKLLFENSFKMKISVIFGVCHMTIGILLKFLNNIHYRSILTIVFECIPQIIFLLFLFGFMDLLIIKKWTINWWPIMDKYNQPPPYIITYMTDMFMKFGNTSDNGYPILPFGNKNEMISMNKLLIVVLLLCIPLMLVVKPVILNFTSGGSAKKSEPSLIEDLDRSNSKSQVEIGNLLEGLKSHHHEEFQFGEAFVHQAIETIEFCLGAISNTASYLRLWALSLAHGQLAEVFYGYSIALIFKAPITDDPNAKDLRTYNFFAMVILYIFLAGVTFAILMCIDILECFLHTLRLHWVEFQNKFYKAEGYAFKPYSFETTIMSTK